MSPGLPELVTMPGEGTGCYQIVYHCVGEKVNVKSDSTLWKGAVCVGPVHALSDTVLLSS